MISKSISLVPVLLAGLALWQWQVHRHSQQRLQKASIGKKPVEVTTWEGEGGALRGSGSQLGPAPQQR